MTIKADKERYRTVSDSVVILATAKLYKYTRTTVLLVGVYGCGTWFLALKKDYILTLSAKRMLIKIFILHRKDVKETFIEKFRSISAH